MRTLNLVYKQAVANNIVVESEPIRRIPYDRNGDGYLTYYNEGTEIIDILGSLYPGEVIIFIVKGINGTSAYGTKVGGWAHGRYLFVPSNSSQILRTCAHELGHYYGLVDLDVEKLRNNQCSDPDTDSNNLMSYCGEEISDHKLRRNQWDANIPR